MMINHTKQNQITFSFIIFIIVFFNFILTFHETWMLSIFHQKHIQKRFFDYFISTSHCFSSFLTMHLISIINFSLSFKSIRIYYILFLELMKGRLFAFRRFSHKSLLFLINYFDCPLFWSFAHLY
jgi:hypothetical protein